MSNKLGSIAIKGINGATVGANHREILNSSQGLSETDNSRSAVFGQTIKATAFLTGYVSLVSSALLKISTEKEENNISQVLNGDHEEYQGLVPMKFVPARKIPPPSEPKFSDVATLEEKKNALATRLTQEFLERAIDALQNDNTALGIAQLERVKLFYFRTCLAILVRGRPDKKALVIAHRDELTEQNSSVSAD